MGVANTKLPTYDPSKVSKGAMGQMSVEDGVEHRGVHMSDKGLVGVPTGVQGPIEKDDSGQDVTETTQVTNNQGHPFAPSVNGVLDKVQGPIGAFGPAMMSDDGSDEVVFSSPAKFQGSEEAVMPQHFLTTRLEDASFLSGMKPCIESKMLSECDAFVTGMSPLRSVCGCALPSETVAHTLSLPIRVHSFTSLGSRPFLMVAC